MFGIGKDKNPEEAIKNKIPVGSSYNRTLHVKKLNEDAKLPEYAHEGDAGMDLHYYSESDTDTVVYSGAKGQFRTGISVAIPEGYVGLIWEKSGLASKKGIQVLGGVIDSGYRGEVVIVLKNTGVKLTTIKSGDKIAQLLIQPVAKVDPVEVEVLPEANDERGVDGFGSTGV